MLQFPASPEVEGLTSDWLSSLKEQISVWQLWTGFLQMGVVWRCDCLCEGNF